MQVEHLFSYGLNHELWNQNLIDNEGYIIANKNDLKRYKTYLEEQPRRRGAEIHQNRKRLLDDSQELLKFENLAPNQQKDLDALLQSLHLDFGEDGYIVDKPDVLPTKKNLGVREPKFSVWELKLDEAARAKRLQKRDLKTLDKFLSLISGAKVKARSPTFMETMDCKELYKKCQKRTRGRLNKMEMKRRDKINDFHAESDYAWKKICGMKVSPKKISKENSFEMTPLQKVAPYIVAPPKSAIDRGFGVPKKESVTSDKRDETKAFSKGTPDNACDRQKVSEIIKSVGTIPLQREEKVFGFGDHVSLAERDVRRKEKVEKRMELFRKMTARKIGEEEGSSKVLAINVSEPDLKKRLTSKNIEQNGVQLIKASQNLALPESLESTTSVESKPVFCSIDDITEQCGTQSRLESITEVPFKDLHKVTVEVPFDFRVREAEGSSKVFY